MIVVEINSFSFELGSTILKGEVKVGMALLTAVNMVTSAINQYTADLPLSNYNRRLQIA